MRVSLKKIFSIVDGRLTTEMSDVYAMLDYIFDCKLATHQIPTTIRKLQELNPAWLKGAVVIIEQIKEKEGAENFKQIIHSLDSGYANVMIELEKIDATIDFKPSVKDVDYSSKLDYKYGLS